MPVKENFWSQRWVQFDKKDGDAHPQSSTIPRRWRDRSTTKRGQGEGEDSRTTKKGRRGRLSCGIGATPISSTYTKLRTQLLWTFLCICSNKNLCTCSNFTPHQIPSNCKDVKEGTRSRGAEMLRPPDQGNEWCKRRITSKATCPSTTEIPSNEQDPNIHANKCADIELATRSVNFLVVVGQNGASREKFFSRSSC